MANHRKYFDDYPMDKSGDCWLWMGSIFKGRRVVYGRIGAESIPGSPIAHRAAWIHANGPIPDGKWVLHRCDVGICCRPAHLFLGDCKANMQDCVSKGRFARGEMKMGSRQGYTKLVASQVLDIRRRMYLRHLFATNAQELAKEYGVDENHVRQIVRGPNGNAWQHLYGLGGLS